MLPSAISEDSTTILLRSGIDANLAAADSVRICHERHSVAPRGPQTIAVPFPADTRRFVHHHYAFAAPIDIEYIPVDELMQFAIKKLTQPG
jgi:hypothetical protein